MIYDLVKKDNPILFVPTSKFDFDNPIVDPKELVENLAETMIKHNGVGLAAPQCGFPLSVFVVGNPGEKESILGMFNPRIVDYSGENVLMKEGCLSFPALWINVKRPESIRIRYTNFLGETITERYNGFSARVIQHEYDHTQGIVYTKLANKIHLQKALKDQKLFLRKFKKKQ